MNTVSQVAVAHVVAPDDNPSDVQIQSATPRPGCVFNFMLGGVPPACSEQQTLQQLKQTVMCTFEFVCQSLADSRQHQEPSNDARGEYSVRW